MKKLLLGLLGLLLSVSVAFAAAPACVSVTSFDKEVVWGVQTYGWQSMYRIKLECVGTGNDDDEVLLSSYISERMLGLIQGGILKAVHTGPGSQVPDAVVVIGLDGDLGEDIETITTTSAASQFEEWVFTADHVIWDIGIDLPDIGDASDVIIMYFTVVK